MAAGMLDGVKVLDFTIPVVGSFCSRILADMGAEIIKIDRPVKGRPVRYTAEALESGLEMIYLHCNGGKRSLCVDLKDPRGVDLVRALVKQVDAIIENFTPRVLRSFGLDYHNVRAINPSIVMCSLTGYGQQGLEWNPDHPCTDPTAQAMAGLNWITGERNGAPYTTGGAIGDTITALVGALAVGYALYHRQRTGIGQYIDISMLESVLFADCTAMPYAAARSGANIHHRNGKQNTFQFPMGVVKSKEGYISIHAPGAGPESAWGRLCVLMDRPDLIDDPRYRTDRDRIAHTEEMLDIIEGWLQTLSDDEAALVVLAEARISSGPVLSQTQILQHPYFRARGAFQTVDYPELGPIEVVAPPFKFSETPAWVRGPAPQEGEHNEEILTSYLGLSAQEIQALTEQGVLYQSEGARQRRMGPEPGG